MKRTSVSICTVVSALVFAAACSSGDADPNAPTTSSSSSAASSGSGGGSTSSGTGGEGTGGSGPPSICDNNVHEIPADQGFIDDFETDKKFAGWYAFADTDPNNFKTIAREAGGAAMTTMAGHVSGTGVKAPTAGGFGAGVGFGLKDENLACAGISAFDGISFWAKGSAGEDNSVRFQAVHPATQAKMDGGDCESNCYNHPGKAITLTADWKQYTIKWSELAGPVKVDGIILGLNWITPGPDFDIWIDEVTLYAGSPPPGPVGDNP